ncbi:MAG: D-aminoacyl-tRNA deacylase [Pseudomonadota bacterium]
MRALLQRAAAARVEVGGEIVGHIGAGLLIFVCAMPGDDEELVERLAVKISKIRIFKDQDGRMNRSILDTAGTALVVSQFTLSADTSRGNRPGFSGAAAPELAERLYLHFVATLQGLGVATQTGQFGADMAVHLINDGPVTIWLDTDD